MQIRTQTQQQSMGVGFGMPPPVPRPVFDEVRDSAGQFRPHWQPFFDHTPDIHGPEFARRWREAQQLIRENGVTYNVYGDPNGLRRPWQLDPLPVIIPADEAGRLEAGLTQRGRLLELVLADLYGPQRLLKDGLLPAELVFANPGFLRACHGIVPPNGRYLHLYAANLGRRDDGEWVVLRDRTQAPAGAGYALENRIVVSRTFPEAFQACRVQRMAAFFQTLINTLRGIARRNRDNPRIVLLTPGPYNEAYFEHSYLARYLGITLAEGGDLTVRDRQVYLKVLGGLQPVDVLFRRLDDDFCDPLELRPDSFLGVPGLVQAVRAGNVVMANALGAGAVELPALTPYLPQLANALLGEELMLDSAPTWWCGDADALRYVLGNSEHMVLKGAFPGSGMRSVLLDECSAADRAAHLDRLRADPQKYVAQSRLPLSSVPVFGEDRADTRRLVLRAFLAADGGTFQMMPGGLSCFGSNSESRSVSMPLGGGSKDTWVQTRGEVNTFTMLPPSDRPLPLTRAGGDLPSRAADNLFWLGRYAERAEGTSRLLRGVLTRMSDRVNPTDHPEVAPLLRALVTPFKPVEGDPEPSVPTTEREVFGLVFTPTRPVSLAATVAEWQRVAGLVRDRISLDMWRVVSVVHRTVTAPTVPESLRTVGEVLDVLDRTVVNLAAFGGLASESMTRGEGWRFLDLGRKLERSLNLLTLVRFTLGTVQPHDGPVLDAVLEIADARMTYRRRYLNHLRPEAVLDLVLFDETNPRSLVSLLLDVRDDVDQLPRPGSLRSPEQLLALQVIAAVQLADVDRLTVVTDCRRPQLEALLKSVADALPVLSDALTHHYLSHLQITRHLAQGEGGHS